LERPRSLNPVEDKTIQSRNRRESSGGYSAPNRLLKESFRPAVIHVSAVLRKGRENPRDARDILSAVPFGTLNAGSPRSSLLNITWGGVFPTLLVVFGNGISYPSALPGKSLQLKV